MIHPLIDLGCTLRDALIDHYGWPCGKRRRVIEHEHITSDGIRELQIVVHLDNGGMIIANVPLDQEAGRDRTV